MELRELIGKDLNRIKRETLEVKRGEIFLVHLGKSEGCEQGGVRPSVVVQNNIGNQKSPTTIIVPITSSRTKRELATHVSIKLEGSYNKNEENTVLCEQIRVVDKSKLGKKLGQVGTKELLAIEKAMLISVGVDN